MDEAMENFVHAQKPGGKQLDAISALHITEKKLLSSLRELIPEAELGHEQRVAVARRFRGLVLQLLDLLSISAPSGTISALPSRREGYLRLVDNLIVQLAAS